MNVSWYLRSWCSGEVEVASNIPQCIECIKFTQRMCHRCGGGYCLIHNEGSNLVAVCSIVIPITWRIVTDVEGPPCSAIVRFP
ncbi:hypothetical protein B0H67DRAFT_496223 [Lasiosphaeris hirsuta]|uniref:Uncharacterized protein n=1 Tax=Lasiosphaeris hirsuta TaxID=260670 RepID=A0AA40DL35_9PEZI|nr:hypothetical protein B0H67DRAFT_496223 [Lasiosphaeris hirsuta]